MYMCKILRGKINGRELYSRLLIRRRPKPCVICGNFPEVDAKNKRIICHTCKVYMEDDDMNFVWEAWNNMERYIKKPLV